MHHSHSSSHPDPSLPPAGDGHDSLEAALLLAGMRELYKTLRHRADAADRDDIRAIYQSTADAIAAMVDDQDRRRQACRALATMIADEVARAIRDPSSPHTQGCPW